MATLDTLPRQQLFQVFNEMSHLLSIQEAVRRKQAYFKQKIIDLQIKENSANKASRFLIFVALFFLFAPFVMCTMGALMIFTTSDMGIPKPYGIIPAVISAIILIIIIVIFAKYKKSKLKNNNDKNMMLLEVNKYIGFYNDMYNVTEQKLNVYYKTYNVPKILTCTYAIRCVTEILNSHTNVTLFEAINEYTRQLEHEQQMSLINKQNSIMQARLREEQAFYDKQLKLQEQNMSVNRQKAEMISDIRYYTLNR